MAVLAVWRLGASVVLLSPAWKRGDVEHALAVSRPAHAVGDHPVLAELMPMHHLDEPIEPIEPAVSAEPAPSRTRGPSLEPEDQAAVRVDQAAGGNRDPCGRGRDPARPR